MIKSYWNNHKMGDYNWCVKHNGRSVNVYDRVNQIKADLKILLPEIDESRYIQIIGHCKNFYLRQKRKKEIKKPYLIKFTDIEKIVYDYLLKNKINPQTAYKIFLITRLPSDVMNQLYKGQISVKSAKYLAQNRMKAKQSNLGLLMQEEIKNIVESWKNV